MPRLSKIFVIKEDVYHQHWTSDGNRYNVGMLYDYAKAVTDPEEIPLDALQYGFEHTNVDEKKWSDAFVTRCQESSLDFPILVVKDKKGKFWIADGNHRYGKAVMQNLEMIDAYVVDEKNLPEKAIEQDTDEDDSGSHKQYKSGGYQD